MPGEPTCPFCGIADDRVAFRTAQSLALWDGFPVTEGHLLVIPKRHVPSWHELSPSEVANIGKAIKDAQKLLRRRYGVDAFNVGFNEGAAAGQTVPHFHVHVIPRRQGDMADPRGGVRHVIPGKGNYMRPPVVRRTYDDVTPHDRALIAGGDDALLPSAPPRVP
jgi:diadenosine tetraphosphate (Ap4A) HIT family hydrolase